MEWRIVSFASAFIGFVGCLPVEAFEVLPNVDWIAAVPVNANDETGSLQPGRLYPVGALNEFVLSDRPVWLVGFSQSQLDDARLPSPSASTIIVRPRAPTEPMLPEPLWNRPLASAGPVPVMTTDRLAVPRHSLVPASTAVFVFAVSEQRSSCISAYGKQRSGPMLALKSGSVYIIESNRLRYLNNYNSFSLESFIQYEYQYWATDGNDLWSGPSLDSMRIVSTDGFWDGRFVFTDTQLLFVTTHGGITLLPEQFGLIEPLPQTNTTADQLQVAVDIDGSVIAAGTDWSWRWHQNEIPNSAGVRSPFGRLGGRLVFARGSELLEALSPSQGITVIADSNDVRAFGEIVDIASYNGGLLVVDVDGHISWVDPDGLAYHLLTTDNRPRKFLSHRDDVFLVTESPNCLRNPTTRGDVLVFRFFSID